VRQVRLWYVSDGANSSAGAWSGVAGGRRGGSVWVHAVAVVVNRDVAAGAEGPRHERWDALEGGAGGELLRDDGRQLRVAFAAGGVRARADAWLLEAPRDGGSLPLRYRNTATGETRGVEPVKYFLQRGDGRGGGGGEERGGTAAATLLGVLV
jgi:hypothetical protein